MAQVWVGWAGPGVVSHLMSETHSEIRLVPPIEIRSDRDLLELTRWVEAYCMAAFEVYLEPQVIDASNWREGLPTAI